MSKREAADYITKDGKGSMSAQPDHPRAATAAQMAQRKLKAPRGRRHGGLSTADSSSFSSGTAPNLFGQIGGGNNPFSTISGNNTNTPAFNFSTSASFPPSNPSPVNFAPVPPSGSFTFAPQTTSNPFSGLGNSTGNTGTNNISFAGFGAQTNGPVNPQSDGDTMMESPQKKPPAFGTAFGMGSGAAPSGSPFSFGQSPQSGTPAGFGASATGQPSNSIFNFGQSQPAAQTGNAFSFGAQKPEEPKPPTTWFGQSLNTSQPAANPFGQPAGAASSSSSLFSQSNTAFNPPSNPFGQTPATSTPGNIFGNSAPVTQPSSSGPFSTLFGQAPATTKHTNEEQNSSEASKPSFGFASSTSQPAFSFSAAPVSTSNTTSSDPTPQVPGSTPISSTPDSTSPIFTGGSTSSSFGDIFKPNANARLASPETGGTSTRTASPKSNPFNLKPNPKSSQPGFSSSGGLLGPKASEGDSSSGPLGPVTPAGEPSSTTAAHATSQKLTQDEQERHSISDSSTNDNTILEKTPTPEQTPQPRVEPTKPEETTNQFFKGFQPQPSTQQPLSSSISTFGNPFDSSSKKNLSTARQEKPPLVNSHNATTQPADSQVKQSPWPLAAPQSTSATSKGTAPATSESDVRLRSYGSSAIPGYLDSDESVEHDSLSRLRNLNASFQKTIAKLDPAADDFEETVRHYVAQRARIGRSLNLKERNKAGMKRKMDNSSESVGQLNGSKKARTDALSSESANSGMPSAKTENSNTSTTIQPPNTVTTQSAFQATIQASNTGSSSATSTIFKHMMSSPTPSSSASLSTSSTSELSGSLFSGVKASAPSSNVVASRSDAKAASFNATKDAMQSKTAFASLAAPSSTSSNSSPSVSSTPVSNTQVPSTTPAKSPPKKPVFEVPHFGTSSGTNFMDAFAKQSAKSAADLREEAKRKRKAEEFDSDEDDEAEWERKYEEEERAKRNKLQSLSKTGSTAFQPLFGGKETSATAKTFFSLANSKTSDLEKEASSTGVGSSGASEKAAEESVSMGDVDSNGSRSSEEHGESGSQEEVSDQSTEDDNGPYEEDESEGDYDQEEDDEEGEGRAPEDESEDEDIQAAMARSRSKGSLFDRIEPNPNLKRNDASKTGAQNMQKKPNGISSTSFGAKDTPNGRNAPQAAANSSFKAPAANRVLNSGASTSTPSAPTMSPFTPIIEPGSDNKNAFTPVGSNFTTSKKPEVEDASSSKKPNGEKFSFAPHTSASAPSTARSVLFGGNITLGSGAIPGEGLFGSRPSTPSNDESLRNSVFGNLGSGPSFSSPHADKTYQRGTPLKFGTPNKEGPVVNVTAATPPAKDDSSVTSKSFPNLFGPKPSKPDGDALASVGFNFGGPTHLTASPLLGPSTLSSAVSSRATSPGATDTESVNTDTAEEHSDEPQTSLMSSRPGEENEEVLFEARSKALKYITEEVAKEKKLDPGFNTQGVGQLRVLKHKTTGKTRVLLRAEPGSNIIINTALTPSMTYKAMETKGSGAIKFGIPNATGIDHWVAKVKTAAMAEELAGILEASKA